MNDRLLPWGVKLNGRNYGTVGKEYTRAATEWCSFIHEQDGILKLAALLEELDKAGEQ